MDKFRVQRIRSRKSSKPERSKQTRNSELADAISTPDNIAMVACTACVNENVVCYYDRSESVKCAECLRHQRNCDGTFALEEFRKVGEQKKKLASKSREKRKEIARLRKALAEAECEDNEVQDSLAHLEDVSERMIRREMLALGAFDRVPENQEVAFADPSFPWAEVPVNDTVDWEAILGSGDTAAPNLGSPQLRT